MRGGRPGEGRAGGGFGGIDSAGARRWPPAARKANSTGPAPRARRSSATVRALFNVTRGVLGGRSARARRRPHPPPGAGPRQGARLRRWFSIAGFCEAVAAGRRRQFGIEVSAAAAHRVKAPALRRRRGLGSGSRCSKRPEALTGVRACGWRSAGSCRRTSLIRLVREIGDRDAFALRAVQRQRHWHFRPERSITTLWPKVRRPFSCRPPCAGATTCTWFSTAQARNSSSQCARPAGVG